MQQYSIDTIVVNDVIGDFEAPTLVMSGVINKNTISIIDIELCGRPIVVLPVFAGRSPASIWSWIVDGNVIAITVDDVVVDNNFSFYGQYIFKVVDDFRS